MRAGGDDQSAAALIEKELVARDLGVRGLARLIAGEGAPPQAIENWRRALIRYRKGGDPTDSLAAIMETRLGKPSGYFPRHRRQERRATVGLAKLMTELAALRAEQAEQRRELAEHGRRLATIEGAGSPAAQER